MDEDRATRWVTRVLALVLAAAVIAGAAVDLARAESRAAASSGVATVS